MSLGLQGAWELVPGLRSQGFRVQGSRSSGFKVSGSGLGSDSGVKGFRGFGVLGHQ